METMVKLEHLILDVPLNTHEKIKQELIERFPTFFFGYLTGHQQNSFEKINIEEVQYDCEEEEELHSIHNLIMWHPHFKKIHIKTDENDSSIIVQYVAEIHHHDTIDEIKEEEIHEIMHIFFYNAIRSYMKFYAHHHIELSNT